LFQLKAGHKVKNKFQIAALLIMALPLFKPNPVQASPYKLNLSNEIFYLGTGATLALTGYVNERKRSIPTEADIAALDRKNIPAFERRFAGKWNKDAQKASDIMLYTGVISPLSLLFFDKKDLENNDYLTLGVMYMETFALSAGGMALAKGSIARYRPYAYGDEAPLSDKLNQETKRSFFSGHTALATSGFIFSASVFSDYYPDSKYKPAVWATAITASVATGWMRVEGGKHFPSDIVTGLAWGGAVGYLVPYLHKKKLHKTDRDFLLFPFMDGDKQGVGVFKFF